LTERDALLLLDQAALVADIHLKNALAGEPAPTDKPHE
jgi:hypothetical protein